MFSSFRRNRDKGTRHQSLTLSSSQSFDTFTNNINNRPQSRDIDPHAKTFKVYQSLGLPHSSNSVSPRAAAAAAASGAYTSSQRSASLSSSAAAAALRLHSFNSATPRPDFSSSNKRNTVGSPLSSPVSNRPPKSGNARSSANPSNGYRTFSLNSNSSTSYSTSKGGRTSSLVSTPRSSFGSSTRNSNIHTKGSSRTSSLTSASSMGSKTGPGGIRTHSSLTYNEFGRAQSLTTTTIHKMGSFDVIKTTTTPIEDFHPPSSGLGSFTGSNYESSILSHEGDLNPVAEEDMFFGNELVHPSIIGLGSPLGSPQTASSISKSVERDSVDNRIEAISQFPMEKFIPEIILEAEDEDNDRTDLPRPGQELSDELHTPVSRDLANKRINAGASGVDSANPQSNSYSEINLDGLAEVNNGSNTSSFSNLKSSLKAISIDTNKPRQSVSFTKYGYGGSNISSDYIEEDRVGLPIESTKPASDSRAIVNNLAQFASVSAFAKPSTDILSAQAHSPELTVSSAIAASAAARKNNPRSSPMESNFGFLNDKGANESGSSVYSPIIDDDDSTKEQRLQQQKQQKLRLQKQELEQKQLAIKKQQEQLEYQTHRLEQDQLQLQQEQEELAQKQQQESLRREELRKEKLLRERLEREKLLKEQQLREQKLREQKLREQQLREQQLREQLREQQLREQLREQQLKEQKLNEEKMEQLQKERLRRKELKEQQQKLSVKKEQQILLNKQQRPQNDSQAFASFTTNSHPHLNLQSDHQHDYLSSLNFENQKSTVRTPGVISSRQDYRTHSLQAATASPVSPVLRNKESSSFTSASAASASKIQADTTRRNTLANTGEFNLSALSGNINVPDNQLERSLSNSSFERSRKARKAKKNSHFGFKNMSLRSKPSKEQVQSEARWRESIQQEQISNNLVPHPQVQKQSQPLEAKRGSFSLFSTQVRTGTVPTDNIPFQSRFADSDSDDDDHAHHGDRRPMVSTKEEMDRSFSDHDSMRDTSFNGSMHDEKRFSVPASLNNIMKSPGSHRTVSLNSSNSGVSQTHADQTPGEQPSIISGTRRLFASKKVLREQQELENREARLKLQEENEDESQHQHQQQQKVHSRMSQRMHTVPAMSPITENHEFINQSNDTAPTNSPVQGKEKTKVSFGNKLRRVFGKKIVVQ